MNFTCSKCGCKRLEEVMEGVTLESEILAINEGDLEYGEKNAEFGEVACYRCVDCGEPIRDEDGMVINDCIELAEYFKSKDHPHDGQHS